MISRSSLSTEASIPETLEMARSHPHDEVHLSYRSNWLRAAVLGANDGSLSVSSLVLGVAASGASLTAILTAGIAGLVAGATSMAAGEYVSVSSQRDPRDRSEADPDEPPAAAGYRADSRADSIRP
jgi:hypothetical protein